MAKLRVATPVPGYTGSVGGLHFAAGVAAADSETHAAELAYCRAQGYRVESDGPPPADRAAAKPSKGASAATWRAWAAENGLLSTEAVATMSRDDLVSHFEEHA